MGSYPKQVKQAFMTKHNFWPLDFDAEEEVYEMLVWDLPGYRKKTLPRVKLTLPSSSARFDSSGVEPRRK
jgi:hypothetical protein